MLVICLVTYFFVDYVEEIFQTYLKTSKDDLDDAARRLRRMTLAPMNMMLEKQPRGEAIKKGKRERVWLLLMSLPTTPGTCCMLIFPFNNVNYTFLNCY